MTPSSVPATPPHVADDEPAGYGEILKSTALIGGSTMLNVGIGLLRTKAMALMLGPAGMGLLVMYQLTADLGRSVAQLGINSSGVRQIAEAAGTGDPVRIERTATVLRRISIVLGLFGAAVVIGFSDVISHVTFGDGDHRSAIALLSLAVLFGVIADAQSATVQGLRRIGDLARIGTVGALVATIAAVALVHAMGRDGIVPAVVAGAVSAAGVAWFYGRKASRATGPVSFAAVLDETASLLRLGVAFMASGLLMLGASYLVRLMVLRHSGLDAAGLYQAAWSLGAFYIGFVLQAMGADFYPRLVGAADDDRRCNRLVNDQAHVSLLLAGPGAIATLAFADVVIAALYSTEFMAAANVLRWICLGMALRVITWPMGFVILAKGNRSVFFATELAWAVVSTGLAWLCIDAFGMDGAGIAFFLSYVFHAAMIYPVVRRMSGFRWTGRNLRLIALFVATLALVFLGFHFLGRRWGMAIGAVTATASGVLSLRALLGLVSSEALPRSVRRGLRLFRLA